MLGLAWSGALALAMAAELAAQAPPAVVKAPDAVQSITAREIGGHLRFLASDLMKGRDTASPESRLAAEYIAAHLFAAGGEPLGDGGSQGRTYFQRFPLEVSTPLEEGTDLTLILESNGSKQVLPCKLGVDFLVTPRGLVTGEVESLVVFAGHGRVDEKNRIDDYRGLNVRNRFVLVYEGQPETDGQPKESAAQPPPADNPFEKAEAARRKGALGVLLIRPPGRQSPRGADRVIAKDLGFSRPRFSLGESERELPTLRLSDSIRDTLAATLGLTIKSMPQQGEVGSLRARFRFAERKEARSDRNVVGYFPGSDPEKKKDVIIFSAHYDHVGVNERGEIFNGSDDNASGTSALLEIAQAFGQGPRPPRSVVFLWVSGEEKGLLGSRWSASHLGLPAGFRVVADINLDMISRNDPHKVGVTPSPSHDEYNSLVPAAQSCGKAEGMEVVFDADEYFHRTDSASFAARGVPVIFFFAGVHADYHRPGDDFEKADLDKAARITRVAYRLGWHVAESPALPAKLKPQPGAATAPK